MEEDKLIVSISEERQKIFETLKEKYNPESSKLRRYQYHLVDVLIEFDNLCNKNGIRYWLAYGTLLGAIRHKGFIPWDDDADLWMDRENYRKLEKLMKGNFHELTDKLSVAMGIRPELWSPPFAYIDIFILDARPNNKILAFIKEWAIRWVYVMIKLRGRVGMKEWGRYKKFIPLLPIALLHSVDGWKRIYNKVALWFVPAEGTCGNRCVQCYNETMSGLARKYPSDILNHTLYAEFEGHWFPISHKYDEVLHICYGDYMNIPDDMHIHEHSIVSGVNI